MSHNPILPPPSPPTSPTETSSTPLPSTPSSPFTSLHLILPTPTYTPQPPYPSKKSHARKQPANHIPRPRNAFMLFRSDLIRQKKIPPEVENDQGNISRIAGTLWRSMSPEDKQPWLTMAIQEKQLHCSLHPGYRYAPIGPRRRKGTTQTQAPVPEKVQKRVQERERPKVKASWGPLDFPSNPAFLILPTRRPTHPKHPTRIHNTHNARRHAQPPPKPRYTLPIHPRRNRRNHSPSPRSTFLRNGDGSNDRRSILHPSPRMC
ncbi:high mobility group box domain-containing protein [Cyathus striatus]|nr:high mobility group box domain-containing protein [Cyathus striatus]